MTNSRLLCQSGIVVRMLLRLTPASAAVDIYDDAKKLKPAPRTRELLADASAALQSVSGAYPEVDPHDRRAAELQLRDMLSKADFDTLLSHALVGADSLERWLTDTRTVSTPLYLGELENYFGDLLTVFCGLAHYAAHDPSRPDTHVRILVGRQGSRLREIDLGLESVQIEIAALDLRLQVLECQRPEVIDHGDRDVFRRTQAAALDGTRPEVLPEADRLHELTEAVGTLTFPLLVLGEGGIGKSVLARQLVRSRTEAGEDVLLVPCNRVPAADPLDSVAAIDLALGGAASGARKTIPLSMWIEDATVNEVLPVVVIDTLDLLLREDTADYLEELLEQLAQLSRVVVTCREAEWRELVARPALAAWPEWTISLLSSQAILMWAAAFTNETDVPAGKEAEFLATLQQAVDQQRGRNVFGSPLRLAMTCELYARTGALPEHLTVSDLYRDYWDRRIARDRRGRVTEASGRHETAARDTALDIWAASRDRLIEFVPPPASLTGESRRYLVSDGILHRIGDTFGFFHQTFAEYSVARILVARGSADDLARLRDGLVSSRPGYWGIAGHIANQETDGPRFGLLIHAIPSERPEGLRLLLGWALARKEGGVLATILADATTNRPDLLASCADILDGTPRSLIQGVVDQLVIAIGSASVGLTAVVRTCAGLLLQLDFDRRSALLPRIAMALGARVRDLGTGIYPEHQRLVGYTVGADPRGFSLKSMLDTYEVLASSGRAAMLPPLANLVLTTPEQSSVLAVVLSSEYPAYDFVPGSLLLTQAFHQQEAREHLGWSGWQDLLTAQYPPRWDGCQVRAAATLAENPEIWTDLWESLFRGEQIAMDRLLNAALFVASAHPDRVATDLTHLEPPTTKRGASAFAKLARKVVENGHREATAPAMPHSLSLVAQMLDIAELDPKNVWSAAVRVACGDQALLDHVLTRLASEATAGRIPDGASRAVVDVLYKHSSPEAVLHQEPILLRILSSSSSSTRAQLDGWLAAASAAARDRVALVLADRSQTNAANAAARRIRDWVLGRPDADSRDFVLSLLDTPHTHALRLLLEALVPSLEARSGTNGLNGLLRLLLGRLDDALRAHHDAQVIEWLVNAIRVCVRSAPPSISERRQVLDILGVFRDETTKGVANRELGWTPGVFVQWTSWIATVAAPCATVDQVTDAVLELLTSVDLDEVANRSQRSLTQLLLRVYGTQPLAWNRVEALWPSVNDPARTAIIEALLVMPWPAALQRAAVLARDPLCPPAAANQVLRSGASGF